MVAVAAAVVCGVVVGGCGGGYVVGRGRWW